MFTTKRNIKIEVSKDSTLINLKGLLAEEAIKIIETAQNIRVVHADKDNSAKQ
ncbi:hypothetical protein Xbed_03684 [Xenorhabdus beddingii]|uniref:Uncharacterized protein n=1 Tax=Xenorhabdus beddingii TaxID=40578 RepID=A0A1Y2S701_9GAMM|nr:hypothetical protein [Xenorhabdus beddingii]OTA14126.1 hypothetical protein Xbed_03731 [Xenorhabdus beddingii]OTA14418.1 hypothetical protein Xbed_03684 [Xenorhabdus beddingii]